MFIILCTYLIYTPFKSSIKCHIYTIYHIDIYTHRYLYHHNITGGILTFTYNVLGLKYHVHSIKDMQHTRARGHSSHTMNFLNFSVFEGENAK